MRIVSKFRDYYDIGLGLGYDSHLDYIRTPREMKFDEEGRPEDKSTKEFFKKLNFRSHYNGSVYLEYRIIGFCGVFYPLVIATKRRNMLPAETKYCYSLEELASVIEITRWSRYKEFFDTVGALKNDELFITNYSPIVVVELGNKATWNGALKPYSFFRVVDAYQTFQRIEMFLGNMAAPEKPMPKQTDIEKVKSHGFDPKMGFRKGRGE